MKKIPYLLASLISLPLVAAEKCGITNFVTCIPQKIAEYFLMLIYLPIIPLLSIIQKFLSEPVSISIFHSLWGIMIYVISIFYGLLFLFSGFNFIISGYDAVKRAKAKEWLKNTLLMIFFVQASFVIYSLLNDLSSLLASGVMNMIDDRFFMLTANSLTDLSLSLALGLVYMLILLITVVLVSLRYLIVGCGVVLFPIGLFLYFIPPLRDYGKLILNTLFTLMFLPFFLSLELLMASMMLELPIFENFKVVVMISGFSMVNFTMLFLLVFGLVKAVFSVTRSDVGQAVSMGIRYIK